MDAIYIVVGILILGLMIWVITGSKKRMWYKVYLANNDVMLLYRDLNIRWWRTSDKYLRFKKEDGEEITFNSNGHWILFWESVNIKNLNVARQEVQRIKEAQAKAVGES